MYSAYFFLIFTCLNYESVLFLLREGDTMKKKGFTLIELLAVLVVLSILALISIPITIRIINSSRENSYKRSIASYAQALENYIAVNNIDNAGNDYDLLYNYVNDSKFNTTYSGNRVECNYDPEVNNNTSKSTLIDGKLILRGCRVVNNAKEKISNHKYRYIDRKVELDVDAYEIGNSLFINGELYYVIANSPITQDYVTAIKNIPLTQNEINSNGGVGTNQGMLYYSSDTCGYIDGYSVTTNCKNLYNESNVKIVVDNWSEKKFQNKELKTVDGYSARLIKVSELEKLGYGTISGYTPRNSNVPHWIYGYSKYYWTMTEDPDYSTSIYSVTDNGAVNTSAVFTFEQMVRPVINVYKDKITQED